MREDRFNVAVARPLDKPYIETRKKQGKAPNKALSVGEKLLYLFSVILCVVMAVSVLSRYAKMTELNVGVRNTELEISQIQKENLQLQSEVRKLKSVERIQQFAESKGLELTAPKYLPSVRP
jgi:cell division protein FtsL